MAQDTIDFIEVDTSQTTQKYAQELIQFVQQVRRTLDAGNACRERMKRMNNGTDFSRLEQLFGLDPGEGLIVYTLVTDTVGALRGVKQSAAAQDLIERVG